MNVTAHPTIRSLPFCIRHSATPRRLRSGFGTRRSRALTLVEIVVVIVVIAILAAAILTASSSLLNKSRSNNTQAVLQIVSDAVEEFKREQTARPTISQAKQNKRAGVGDPTKDKVLYADRYGAYPPDELEVFSPAGLRGSVPAPAGRTNSLAAGGAVIVPAPDWPPMRFYKDGTPADIVEHRDQCAMIVAIETLSESANSILDRIPDKNRSPGALSVDGQTPALFLDRPGGAAAVPDRWDPDDHQIRYILDDWGMPISYFAQRDGRPELPNPIQSSNHDGWNEASTEFIRLNGGSPVVMSYGPNGKDQLTKDAMDPNANASLVGDFEKNDDEMINDPLNDDNVYANPALREKLAKGIKAP